ncbi:MULTISPECIES: helix-turn-helix transcriptional regulator [Catenuloplanes]|uniref:ArsR family transcriptional regulator n=1 Tax=Catenuloplanes niger TaxID=587534 RepID=A0AAE3ZVM2_9ACTN|nr:helix-turn-helix domain-containing protein [Catenuloplanes niger]MDR7326869.1 putative ArsR family transcriptional regulator [Catenuloplanes niger]
MSEPAVRRREVLELLRAAAGPVSIGAVAERLGIHPNTARFHLETLARSGHADRVHGTPDGPGRPPLLFTARREMDRGGPRNYRVLAELLADDLARADDPIAAAQDAGRRWGSRVADDVRVADGTEPAIVWLHDMLDDLGFAPDPPRVAGRDGEIGLRHCPFLDLVDTHGGMICALHEGLLESAMDGLTAPVAVDGLTPFATPDRCLVTLRLEG